jgi:hypothetical protein
MSQAVLESHSKKIQRFTQNFKNIWGINSFSQQIINTKKNNQHKKYEALMPY